MRIIESTEGDTERHKLRHTNDEPDLGSKEMEVNTSLLTPCMLIFKLPPSSSTWTYYVLRAVKKAWLVNQMKEWTNVCKQGQLKRSRVRALGAMKSYEVT